MVCFYYGCNLCVLSYLCFVEVGWWVDLSVLIKVLIGGVYGYDNMVFEMCVLFIVYGLVFKVGKMILSFDNVVIELLICDLIGLFVEFGLDGDDMLF